MAYFTWKTKQIKPDAELFPGQYYCFWYASYLCKALITPHLDKQNWEGISLLPCQ